jgi:hypothetical protein
MIVDKSIYARGVQEIRVLLNSSKELLVIMGDDDLSRRIEDVLVTFEKRHPLDPTDKDILTGVR